MILLLIVSGLLASASLLVESHDGMSLMPAGHGDAVLASSPYPGLLLAQRTGEKAYLKDIPTNTVLSSCYGRPCFVPYASDDCSNLLDIVLYAPGMYKIKSGRTCLDKALGKDTAWNPCTTARTQLWSLSFPGAPGDREAILAIDMLADRAEKTAGPSATPLTQPLS